MSIQKEVFEIINYLNLTNIKDENGNIWVYANKFINLLEYKEASRKVIALFINDPSHKIEFGYIKNQWKNKYNKN